MAKDDLAHWHIDALGFVDESVEPCWYASIAESGFVAFVAGILRCALTGEPVLFLRALIEIVG